MWWFLKPGNLFRAAAIMIGSKVSFGLERVFYFNFYTINFDFRITVEKIENRRFLTKNIKKDPKL